MSKNTVLNAQMGQLAQGVMRLTKSESNIQTAIPGFSVFKISESTKPLAGYYEPCVCLIAQGAKHVQLNDDMFVYDTPLCQDSCRLSFS